MSRCTREGLREAGVSGASKIRQAFAWMPARLIGGVAAGFGAVEYRLVEVLPHLERLLLDAAGSVVPGVGNEKLSLAFFGAIIVSCGLPWLTKGGERWVSRALNHATRILPLSVGALAGHGIGSWSTPLDAGAIGHAVLLVATSIIVVMCLTIVTAGLHGAMARPNRSRLRS